MECVWDTVGDNLNLQRSLSYHQETYTRKGLMKGYIGLYRPYKEVRRRNPQGKVPRKLPNQNEKEPSTYK